MAINDLKEVYWFFWHLTLSFTIKDIKLYLKANQMALDIGDSARKAHYYDEPPYDGICHTGSRSLLMKKFATDWLTGKIRRYGRQGIPKASMDVDFGSLRRSAEIERKTENR